MVEYRHFETSKYAALLSGRLLLKRKRMYSYVVTFAISPNLFYVFFVRSRVNRGSPWLRQSATHFTPNV